MQSNNVLIITSSPTVGGNGDVIASIAANELTARGANASMLNLRNLDIQPIATGQDSVAHSDEPDDDFPQLLAAIHQADAIIVISPIYYNNLEARLITAIDRLYYPIALRNGYERGPKKRLGVILTCEGSSSDWLKLLVDRTLTKSLRASVADIKTEVFGHCPPLQGKPINADYWHRTISLADWCIQS
ncbi:flavodoxin family protein [Bifidobacterium scardovii]|uniref:NADPH-dependent FMN reductase n=1 Tax=Bifidobacterium scardovii TaxID=158787 RepID=A0A087D7V2_9BIFI|nr:flavodoxin family protein [Bifidobacterium scardovii]KFI91602.1 NADPH-dependent FMN reductase [Bifidobacterium scardovii]MDK6348874.1 flavodoxin family protein [Bifidobacterium scardovii]MDU8980825.1 flavodoxin family protein [Bifidobacterium scardovii]